MRTNEIDAYTLLQLHIDKQLQTSIWKFLLSRYGEIILFESTAYKVTIILSGGNYTEGIYIECTTKGYNVYKTLPNNEKDTTRQLYGYYKGAVTMTSASDKANSLVEYKELGLYLIEKIYFTIYNVYTQEYLEHFVDNETTLKKIGVRENSFNVLKHNRKDLYQFIKELTKVIGNKYTGNTYRIIENSFGYLSVDNYLLAHESELVIINNYNEILQIIGNSNREKGFNFAMTDNIQDDYLYSLQYVLSEFQVRNKYMDIHKQIIKERVVRELDYYVKKESPKVKSKSTVKEKKVTKKKAVKRKN